MFIHSAHVFLAKVVAEREAEVRSTHEQSSKLQADLARLRQELQDKSSQEDTFRQQVADKEEKTRKVIINAKQKISQLIGEKSVSGYPRYKANALKISLLLLLLPSVFLLANWPISCYKCLSLNYFFHLAVVICQWGNVFSVKRFLKRYFSPGSKDQLQKENEELKQQREEMELRVSTIKSQYEGRLSRQEREIRDLRGQQERQEQRDEPQEAGPSKVRVFTDCTLSLFLYLYNVYGG